MELTSPKDMDRSIPTAAVNLAQELSDKLSDIEGFKDTVSLSVDSSTNYRTADEVCKMFMDAGWGNVTFKSDGDQRTNESWASFEFTE